MPKRKAADANDKLNAEHEEGSSEESSSDSGDDVNMLDVEFEWFDPQPNHDFHGIKTLLRQLLDVDAQLFDLSALAELILAQPLLGSTVKVDGNETDPFAFLSVVNLREYKTNEAVVKLARYLRDRASAVDDLTPVANMLAAADASQVGLILTERLMNLPAEVSPPMYKMLLEEISWALEEKEPYNFSHYLIVSKTYHEVASQLDGQDEESRMQKKKKKKAAKRGASEDLFYFHPEDEVLHKFAQCCGTFSYKSDAGESDSKRAFQELGIKPSGHLILIEAAKFAPAVKAMQEYFGQT